MRRNLVKLAGGVAAMAALGVAAAPSTSVETAPSSQRAPSPSKDYDVPRARPAERKKKRQRNLTPLKWRRTKKGDAFDGRGDFRSAKRLRRRDLMLLLAALGKPQSGRQLRIVRKALAREGR